VLKSEKPSRLLSLAKEKARTYRRIFPKIRKGKEGGPHRGAEFGGRDGKGMVQEREVWGEL